MVINTIEDDERRPCAPELNKNFDETLYKMANADLEKLYQCTIPFLPAIVSNTTGVPTSICKNLDTGKLAMERYLGIESDLLSSMPCARMDIFLGMPAISNDSAMPGGSIPYQGYGYDHTSFILLYFKTNIKVKHIVWDYDSISLVAEIGGYTGLLLGFPIARGVIWINSIILKVITRVLNK